MSLSFAVDSSPPGFIQQYTQATKNAKGATNSTTCGLKSAVFDARRKVWNITNNVVVVSGYCNSALTIDVNIIAGQGNRNTVKGPPRMYPRAEQR